jgi:hypothetical protein
VPVSFPFCASVKRSRNAMPDRPNRSCSHNSRRASRDSTRHR